MLLLNWRVSKSPASVDRQSEISVTLSHYHFSDGNHGGCGNAAFVLPEFAAIYKTFNTPLPALTQGIATLASFSGEWGWLLVLFGFLLAIANSC